MCIVQHYYIIIYQWRAWHILKPYKRSTVFHADKIHSASKFYNNQSYNILLLLYHLVSSDRYGDDSCEYMPLLFTYKHFKFQHICTILQFWCTCPQEYIKCSMSHVTHVMCAITTVSELVRKLAICLDTDLFHAYLVKATHPLSLSVSLSHRHTQDTNTDIDKDTDTDTDTHTH